ncbi:MAG: hypothetical protein HY816_19920 [Candidatus Wallbacteria bacterium]|nr:hypothetical protein [Candidatus Wallbacteria bacterium]
MKTLTPFWLCWHLVTAAAFGQSLHMNQQYMPTAGEKAALVGSSGTPGSGNKFVTQSDGHLLTDAISATFLNRANHTGTQPRSTISNWAHGSTHSDPNDDPIPLGLGLRYNGLALDVNLGTGVGMAAAGANTIGLVGSSFTFGPAISFGASGTIAISPTFGTAAATFCEGNDARLGSVTVQDGTGAVILLHADTIAFTGAGVALTDDGSGHLTATISGGVGGGGEPAPHQSSHQIGGSDALPAASSGTAGLVKLAPSGAVSPTYAVEADDPRLSNSRTPTAHQSSHRIGGSDQLPAASTGTAGLATLATDGESSSSKAVAANDSRLSNARAPIVHSDTHLSAGSDPIPEANTITPGLCPAFATDGQSAALKPVQANDSRLSNSRTPTAHASTHLQEGGTDPLATASTSTYGLAKLAADGGALAGTCVQGNDTRLTRGITIQDEGTIQDVPLNVKVINVVGPGVEATVNGVTATFTVASGSTSGQGTLQLATDGESSSSKAAAANDSRLSNSRTPTAHQSSHQIGGSDALPAASSGTAGLVKLAPAGAVSPTYAVEADDPRLGVTGGASWVWRNYDHGSVTVTSVSAQTVTLNLAGGDVPKIAWLKLIATSDPVNIKAASYGGTAYLVFTGDSSHSDTVFVPCDSSGRFDLWSVSGTQYVGVIQLGYIK